MAKKGKGGKGKKGKKGPVDWAAQQTTRYVEVEVRNSVWQTLRFTQRMPTSTKIVRRRRSGLRALRTFSRARTSGLPR